MIIEAKKGNKGKKKKTKTQSDSSENDADDDDDTRVVTKQPKGQRGMYNATFKSVVVIIFIQVICYGTCCV